MPRLVIFVLLLCSCAGVASARQGQNGSFGAHPANKQSPSEKRNGSKQNATKAPSQAEELQMAISDAGNDRGELVKNLKAFLAKYPEAQERPQIYRALVEACMQFKDDPCAMDYAERIVALTPDDTSMTLLAVQLLERNGDQAALRRAVTYVTRVNDSVRSTPISDKSPRVSLEEWEEQQKRDEYELLGRRGRLEGRLNERTTARTDYEASYALQPNATAAMKLGELEELAKNYDGAAMHYARAFALSESETKSGSRREIREKL